MKRHMMTETVDRKETLDFKEKAGFNSTGSNKEEQNDEYRKNHNFSSELQKHISIYHAGKEIISHFAIK